VIRAPDRAQVEVDDDEMTGRTLHAPPSEETDLCRGGQIGANACQAREGPQHGLQRHRGVGGGGGEGARSGGTVGKVG
jgi:hypothetical protein